MVETFILRTRFKDTRDFKTLLRRKDDWVKDLNMNLVKAKVIRSTLYFDDLMDAQKLALLKSLETEQGSRDEADTKHIEPYVRSISLFKPYAEFTSDDF